MNTIDITGSKAKMPCEGKENMMKANNVAAMREALEAFQRWYEEVRSYVYHSVKLAIAVDEMRAALSAPPRNCDRFEDADAAVAAFRREMRPGNPNIDLYHVIDWLFAPEEGGAK